MALDENRNEPLPPKQIRGIFRSIPSLAVHQHRFDAPLREAWFAHTSLENRSGKGMSGGIVYATLNNKIAGMVLANGDFEFSIQNQIVERFYGFIFVGSNRVWKNAAYR